MIFLCAWTVMIVGEWVVAALAFQRCRKTYPWFTSLLCFMAVKSVVLFYIRTVYPANYFYPYYRAEFTLNFLQLGSTVEVFGTLFRPFWTVPKKSLTTLFLSTSVSLVTVAHANVVFTGGGEIAFYRDLDRIVSCSTGVSLAAVLLFARHFGMPFRSRVKGICIGLYIMSVTSVLMTLVTSSTFMAFTFSLAFIPVGAHYATLSLWIYYLGRKEALVAVIGKRELEEVRVLLDQFKLALSYTPISCGLTQRKAMGTVNSEQKAKVVNEHA